MLKIGPHVSKSDTPNIQREEARKQGWGVIQTFAGSPQTFNLDPDRVSGDEDGKRDVIWVVHSAYPCLFVPPERSVTATSSYLLRLAQWCKKAGATYMVVHLGATKDKNPLEVQKQAIQGWMQQKALHEFLRESGIKLLIENVAAAYPTNQDLKYTIEITKQTPDILGWCLDTAHSNAAGVHYDVLQSIVEDPQRKPDIIHCNYPGSKFGCGLDRHGWFYKDETPIEDETKPLWKNVVRAAFKSNIPFVVEGGSKEGSHADEVIALRNLCSDL